MKPLTRAELTVRGGGKQEEMAAENPAMNELLTKSVSKLRKFLKKASQQMTPEEVHDFRRHSRRLEVALETVWPRPHAKWKSLRSQIAQLRKRAGKIRDMDVLTDYASTIQIAGEEDCLVQLLEYLGAKRYRDHDKIGQLIKTRRSHLRRRLRSAPARLTRFFPSKTQMTAELGPLMSEVSSQLPLDESNLHSYRLKIKRLRDLWQISAIPHPKHLLNILGRAKDSIGEWHDWKELETTATEVLNHGRNCRLLQEVKAVGNRKYQHALSVCKELRKAFFRPDHRNTKALRKFATGNGRKSEFVANSATAE